MLPFLSRTPRAFRARAFSSRATATPRAFTRCAALSTLVGGSAYTLGALFPPSTFLSSRPTHTPEDLFKPRRATPVSLDDGDKQTPMLRKTQDKVLVNSSGTHSERDSETRLAGEEEEELLLPHRIDTQVLPDITDSAVEALAQAEQNLLTHRANLRASKMALAQIRVTIEEKMQLVVELEEVIVQTEEQLDEMEKGIQIARKNLQECDK